jgi:bilin biosynthesis protein
MNHALNATNDRILQIQSANDTLIQSVNEQITLDQFEPTDEVLAKLVEGLGDPRGLVRLRFAETLGDIGEPATPFLVAALATSADAVLRRAAAKTLTLIADPSAVQALLTAFLHDEDTVVRSSSAGALARTGEAAVPALLEILASTEHSEDIKGHAAWALAFIGSEATEYLYAALKSDSLDVRCAVIGAIAHVAQEQSDEKSCNILISALTDPEPLIRTEAASALGNVNYPAAIPHLVLATKDADVEVRKAAVSGLGKAGDRSVVSALQVAMEQDEAAVVRTLAKLAIAQIDRQVQGE